MHLYLCIALHRFVDLGSAHCLSAVPYDSNANWYHDT